MANILDDVVKRLATPEIGKAHDSPHGSDNSKLTRMTPEARLRIEAASALRDNLDHYTAGPVYPVFLRKVMPVFINILRGPSIFHSNSPEQVSAALSGIAMQSFSNDV